MKTRKVPLRMCIACKQMKPKKELLRLVLPKEGDLSYDDSGRANGRGSYICPDPACLEQLKKNKRIKLPAQLWEQLESEIAKRG